MPALPQRNTHDKSGSKESDFWCFGATDAAVAGVLLTLSAALCVPLACHFRAEAQQLDRALHASATRSRQVSIALQHHDEQQVQTFELRRAVNRYAAEVESRSMVPWTTVVSELSRLRPAGLWATRISGNGFRFRVQLEAEQPDLTSIYLRRLREAPHIDFAGFPDGKVSAPPVQIIGRVREE